MKRSFLFKALLIVSVLLTSACEDKTEPSSSNNAESSTSGGTDFIQCEGDRPTFCTHIYKPVCASIDTGIRCITTPCPSVEFKTYGNACSACADSAVDGFTEGECAENQGDSSSDPADTHQE